MIRRLPVGGGAYAFRMRMIIQSIQRDATVARDGVSLAQHTAISGGTQPTPTSKIVFDKLFSLLALIAISPLILLIGGLILLFEGRPIYFGHTRVGQDGKPFQCWKFRTMVHNAEKRLEEALHANPELRLEWEATRKMKHDPRVSPFGRFLRKTSLDELPQFWNVLRGDMSVVGPRPVVSDELPYYGVHVRDYTSVRPGLTGAWQVSGRSNTTYDERVALDVNYIRNSTIRTDLAIIWRTFGTVLGRAGAH